MRWFSEKCLWFLIISYRNQLSVPGFCIMLLFVFLDCSQKLMKHLSDGSLRFSGARFLFVMNYHILRFCVSTKESPLWKRTAGGNRGNHTEGFAHFHFVCHDIFSWQIHKFVSRGANEFYFYMYEIPISSHFLDYSLYILGIRYYPRILGIRYLGFFCNS